MIRLTLERFDLKQDERGYLNEVNKQDALQLMVDSTEAGWQALLIGVLKTFLSQP